MSFRMSVRVERVLEEGIYDAVLDDAWAAAIMGQIDPKLGWGPEDVIGGKCRVVLDTYVDSQGIEKNGVDKVLKPKPKTADDEENFSDIPF